MKMQIENTFTPQMQAVTAQIVVTGKCLQPALAVLDGVDSDLTALVVVRKDGSKAVVAFPAVVEKDGNGKPKIDENGLPKVLVPEMDIVTIVKLVFSPMEKAIEDIPQDQGGLWVNRAIPSSLPVAEQEAKVVEEGGREYWCVRTILGVGFGHRFSVVEVLLSKEKYQSVLYRIRRFKNNLDGGAKPEGPVQVFGSLRAAIGFAYGNAETKASKGATKALNEFVASAQTHFYGSGSGQRQVAPSRRRPLTTRSFAELGLGNVITDISQLPMAEEESEPELAPTTTKRTRKSSKRAAQLAHAE